MVSHSLLHIPSRIFQTLSIIVLGTIFETIRVNPCAAEESGKKVSNAIGPDQRNRNVMKTSTGPWGTIEYYHFYLEAPVELTSKFRLPSTITRWAFKQSEALTLPALLSKIGLKHELIGRLVTPGRTSADGINLYLFPTRDDVESIPSDVRSKLYAELARNPLNEFYAAPVLFLSDTVEEWAEDSDLPEMIVSKLTALSYHRGKSLAFSDIPLLMSYAESESQAHMIFSKLTRVRTLLARLVIHNDEDISKLIGYWTVSSGGLRHKEIEPLLTAIRRTKGVEYIDLLHVLPPLARKLLYTYVDPKQATLGRFPDCHWTSLNFFNYEPQNFYLDSRLASSAILENFSPVSTPYYYGDILMFMDREKQVIHSCIYLGGDLVFTKNGANISSPWILLQLDDLMQMYPIEEGVIQIVGYRKK